MNTLIGRLLVRIARADSFLFCCVRGPHPEFQKKKKKPLPPGHTRGFLAGASGVRPGVCLLTAVPQRGSSRRTSVRPPARAPAAKRRGPRTPAPQAAGEGGPGRRRRGGAREPGPGVGAPPAAFASPPESGRAARTLSAPYPRADLAPQEVSGDLASREGDRKYCSF